MQWISDGSPVTGTQLGPRAEDITLHSVAQHKNQVQARLQLAGKIYIKLQNYEKEKV